MDKDNTVTHCSIHYKHGDAASKHFTVKHMELIDQSSNDKTTLLDVAKGLQENELQNIRYHCVCRSQFTMKRDLDSILTAEERAEDEEFMPPRKPMRITQNSSTSHVYSAICLFCEKNSKYITGRNTCETLIKPSEQCSDARV